MQHNREQEWDTSLCWRTIFKFSFYQLLVDVKIRWRSRVPDYRQPIVNVRNVVVDSPVYDRKVKAKEGRGNSEDGFEKLPTYRISKFRCVVAIVLQLYYSVSSFCHLTKPTDICQNALQFSYYVHFLPGFSTAPVCLLSLPLATGLLVLNKHPNQVFNNPRYRLGRR